MNETQIMQWLYFCGVFLLIARGLIVVSYLRQLPQFLKYKEHSFLFFGALIGFLIGLFEMIFVYLVKTHTVFFLPYLQRYEIDDTFFISPLYYLNEIIFYGLAFSYAIGGRLQKIIQWIVVLLALAESINTFGVEGYKDAQSVGSLAISAFSIFLSVLYIQNFYTKKIRTIGFRDSFFVISWGILIPAILSLLVYVFTKSLFDTDTFLYYKISIFRMLIESFCLLLVAYGVYLIRRPI
jgi:hypothetical protein